MSRLAYERDLWRDGNTRVAGVDEAGRGLLAGAVVAAAVVFPSDWLESGVDRSLHGLNDSKQLTLAQREKLFDVIINHPDLECGITSVSAEMIDQINILQATHRAMNFALAQLDPEPDHVLVDGRPVKSMVFPQTALVKGDSKSYSIAAASVLAKVTRDRAMLEYDQLYPGYGFAEHKGYGTPKHLAAISELGPCPTHRKTFAPMRPVEMDLFDKA